MLFLQLLLVLFFGIFSQARMSTGLVNHAVEAYEIKDFVITNLFSTELFDRSHRTLNRTISFNFADLNSNTTIKCANTWTKDVSTDGAPTSYLYCGSGPTTEFFIFKFNTYTNAANFVLDLAHSFSDPVHYQAPYTYVEYFASKPFTLNCSTSRGTNRCITSGPVPVGITRISN